MSNYKVYGPSILDRLRKAPDGAQAEALYRAALEHGVKLSSGTRRKIEKAIALMSARA